jgi:hypothetical protein
MNFDRASAKAAGYSDEEIEDYLKTNPSPPIATNPISFGAGASGGTPDYQTAGALAEDQTTSTYSAGGGERDKLMSSWATDIVRDQQRTGGKMKSTIDAQYKVYLSEIEKSEKQKQDEAKRRAAKEDWAWKEVYKQKQKELLESQKKKNKEKEGKKAISGLVTIIGELKGGSKEVGLGDIVASKLGLSSAAQRFDQKKLLAGQYLAKLVEKNRLSDADREFYQNKIMKISPLGFQGPKEESIDSLIRDIIILSGYSPKDFNIKSEKKKDSEGPGFVQQLASNALTDTFELGKGVLQLPQAIVANYEQVQAKHPDKLPSQAELVSNFALNFGKATAQQYNELLGEPLKGGDVVGRIKKRAYEKPVTTALDVLPGIGLAKKALGIGKVGRVASIAGKVDDIGDAGVIGKMDDAGQLPKIGQDPTSLNIAARTFKQSFNLPRKVAERLKPMETAKEIVRDGIVGGYDDYARVAETVTGNNGIFTKAVRRALAKIQQPIDHSSALESIDNLVNKLGAVKDKKEVSRTIMNIVTDKPKGAVPGQMSVLDAYDAIRDLEAQGMQYHFAGYNKLTPNIEYQQLSKVYLGVADELRDKISKAADTENVVAGVKNAQDLEALRKISPRLAEKYANAKTIEELRRTQSPYVKLKQMVDYTEYSTTTPFSKLKRIPVVGSLVEGVAETVAPRAQSMASQVLYNPKRAGQMAGKYIGDKATDVANLLKKKRNFPQ